MAKATESASLSVEPQRTKPRSWLRLPQPCLIAWLPNCGRRIRLKGPDAHRLAPPEQSPPSISWWQTKAGSQSLVKTVAAGGGGRRPVFTRDCQPATLVTEGAVLVHIVLGHSATTHLSMQVRRGAENS